MQNASWCIKAGCLLRNTNCLFLTNYIFVLVHHKIRPKENRNLKNLTLISQGNSVLKQKINYSVEIKYKVCKWSANCNGEFLPFWLATVYQNSCYYVVGKHTYLWNNTHVQSNLLRWGLLLIIMKLSKKWCHEDVQIQRRPLKMCPVVCVLCTIYSLYQTEDNLI